VVLTNANWGRFSTDEHISWSVAVGYALLGQDEPAVEWLENASLRRGFINYPFLSEHDPNLGMIRESAKFQELMSKIRDRWEQFEP
jgi:hypothetical protein